MPPLTTPVKQHPFWVKQNPLSAHATNTVAAKVSNNASNEKDTFAANINNTSKECVINVGNESAKKREETPSHSSPTAFPARNPPASENNKADSDATEGVTPTAAIKEEAMGVAMTSSAAVATAITTATATEAPAAELLLLKRFLHN